MGKSKYKASYPGAKDIVAACTYCDRVYVGTKKLAEKLYRMHMVMTHKNYTPIVFDTQDTTGKHDKFVEANSSNLTQRVVDDMRRQKTALVPRNSI